MFGSEEIRSRMEAAAEAVWAAGRLTLGYFGSELEVERKADDSPVTRADREAEALLRERLGRLFPRDGFLGEESGEREGTSGLRWVVDPIDGTRSFVRGVPLYGVLVGLEGPDGEPFVGAACFPPLGELIVAGRGEGCFLGGRRVRVSRIDSLARGCAAWSGRECFEETGTLDVLERVSAAAETGRTWGDCYGHVLVATGRAEAMLDPVLNDWDASALRPIVEEAGGTFTDWSGRPTARGRSGVSTNGLVDAEVRRLIEAGGVD